MSTTIRLKRSLTVERNLRGEIQDIFRSAREQRLPFATILNMREQRVFTHPLYARLTNRAQTELCGYFSGCLDTHERTQTEWRVSYKGALVIGKDSVPQGEWHHVKAYAGHFTYKGEPNYIYS